MEYIANGLTIACIYILISLGYSLVYRVAKVINLAQGEILIVSGLTLAWLLLNKVNIALSVLICLIVSALIGTLMWTLVFKLLRHIPRLYSLIAGIALAQVLSALILKLYGSEDYVINFDSILHMQAIPGLAISWSQILVIVTTLIIVILMYLILNKSHLGKVIQAVGENEQKAQTHGINIFLITLLVFGIAGILSGVAGLYIGIYYRSFSAINNSIYLKGLVTAIVGGIGNYKGTLIAGLIIGIFEAVIMIAISAQYKDALLFGSMIIVILLKTKKPIHVITSLVNIIVNLLRRRIHERVY